MYQRFRLVIPNTFVYSYVELLDRSSKINTFFFESSPPLSKTVHIQLNESVELNPRNFKYWARYLNKGSVLEISWGLSDAVKLYVIQSTKQFKDWQKLSKGQNYVAMESGAWNKKTFVSDTSEDYYFVIENEHPNTLNGFLSFYIEATSYDTAKAKGFFAGSFRMDFPFASPQYLVLHNPSQTQSLAVQITYSSRVHLILFGALLGEALLLCVWVVYCALCRGTATTDSVTGTPSSLEIGFSTKGND